MRNILFRAKRIDNGEWVEGYLHKKYFQSLPHDRFVIQYKTEYDAKTWKPEYMVAEVDLDTVCQCTGLTDKNGRKIFEGDIVKVIYQSNYIGVGNIDFGASVVEYCGSYYGAASFQLNTIGEIGSRSFTASLDGGVTVIGNMFDSPELLNGWSRR